MILFFIVDSASPYPTEKEVISHHPSPQPLMDGTRTYGKYILQNKTQNMRTDNFGRGVIKPNKARSIFSSGNKIQVHRYCLLQYY